MVERMKKFTPRLPMMETTIKMEVAESAGCKIEETNTPSRSENDVVEKTRKRRMRAKEKPRRKSLAQTKEFPRKKLVKPPTKIKPNHIRQEKRERAEQRLKLKTGSFFIKPT